MPDTATPMDTTIEFARNDDLPALCALLSELFTLETDFVADRDKQLRGLRLLLETPASGRLFVVRTDTRIVGMANALITISTAQGSPVLLLEDVIVDRRFRGMGLGRQLVEHVCAWARAEGMSRVTLLVDRDNLPAQAFYRNLGFEESAMLVRRKLL